MPSLLVQLFAVFLPVFQQIRAEYAANGNDAPTDADMIAAFLASGQKYLAEGKAWTDAHPRP